MHVAIRSNSLLASAALLVSLVGSSETLFAQIDVGSNGSDGVFNPSGNVEVDLGLQGTYDSARWAVIFNYEDVVIPAGVTVTFKNHPSRAPVVWLVQGSVTIGGTIDLNGKAGVSSAGNHSYAEPGPGGFRGGRGEDYDNQDWASSSGFGPGGGFQQPVNEQHGSAASHSSNGNTTWAVTAPRYGNPSIFQLVGGSGGSAAIARGLGSDNAGGGGGGGGGAILIAANDSITVTSTGRIQARGGNGANYNYDGAAGSGGSIRLLSDVVQLASGGLVNANGGTYYYQGGDGRIRIERNNTDPLLGTTSPIASLGSPREVFPAAGSPACRILMVGSTSVPSDPRGGLGFGGETDIMLPTSDPTAVVIETEGVPLNWKVYLRVTSAFGPASEILITDGVTNPLTVTGGPNMQAHVSANVDLPDGYSALQVRAVHPTMAP